MEKLLKKLVQSLALLVLLQATVTVQPDPLYRGERWRVYDNKGVRVEEWRKNQFQPGAVDIYNKKGTYQGTIKPDPVNPGTYRGYEFKGFKSFPSTRTVK